MGKRPPELNENDYLSNMPRDILVDLFKKYLSPKDRYSLAKCSSNFNLISRTNLIWEEQCRALKLQNRKQELLKSLLLKHYIKKEVFIAVYQKFDIEPGKKDMWSFIDNNLQRTIYFSKEAVLKAGLAYLKGVYKCFLRSDKVCVSDTEPLNQEWQIPVNPSEIYSYTTLQDKEFINPFYKYCLGEYVAPQNFGAASFVNVVLPWVKVGV